MAAELVASVFPYFLLSLFNSFLESSLGSSPGFVSSALALAAAALLGAALEVAPATFGGLPSGVKLRVILLPPHSNLSTK